MIAPTKLIQHEDGTWERVAVDAQEIIASKEAQLLKMYEELQAMKQNNS